MLTLLIEGSYLPSLFFSDNFPREKNKQPFITTEPVNPHNQTAANST